MPIYASKYNFCPQCSQLLESAEIGGQIRPKCPKCNFVHWGEYSIGAGGVLWRENKVLLVQRAYNPGKGFWSIPGGYVDQNEKIGDAVAREIKEETGIDSEVRSIIAVRDRPGEKHDVYIIFLMNDLGGELHPQPEEVSDLGFFTLEECRSLQIAPLTLGMIEATLKQPQGFSLDRDIPLIGELATLYTVVKSE